MEEQKQEFEEAQEQITAIEVQRDEAIEEGSWTR